MLVSWPSRPPAASGSAATCGRGPSRAPPRPRPRRRSAGGASAGPGRRRLGRGVQRCCAARGGERARPPSCTASTSASTTRARRSSTRRPRRARRRPEGAHRGLGVEEAERRVKAGPDLLLPAAGRLVRRQHGLGGPLDGVLERRQQAVVTIGEELVEGAPRDARAVDDVRDCDPRKPRSRTSSIIAGRIRARWRSLTRLRAARRPGYRAPDFRAPRFIFFPCLPFILRLASCRCVLLLVCVVFLSSGSR